MIKYGILRLLRKELGVDDAHFTLLYVLPLASSAAAKPILKTMSSVFLANYDDQSEKGN
jgi:hypothetical protein